jgi:hypothetical protein
MKESLRYFHVRNFVFLFVTLLVACGPSGDSSPEGSINFSSLGGGTIVSESSRFGACIHRAADDVMEKIYEGNISWIRVDLDWDIVQPNGPDDWNWWSIDVTVNSAKARGISVYPNIGYSPRWANGGHSGHNYPPTAAHIESWKRFVRAAVERYPSIKYWGLWNEPNLKKFFRGSTDDYIDKILLTAGPILREHGKTIVAPDVSDHENPTRFINRVIGRAGQFVDIIAGHAYGDIRGDLNKYKNHLHGRPFWLTEYGWKGSAVHSINGLHRDSRYNWVEKFFIYHAVGESEKDYHLMVRNGDQISLRPNYFAYRKVAGQDRASIVSSDFPQVVGLGEEIKGTIRFKNRGTTIWKEEFGYFAAAVDGWSEDMIVRPERSFLNVGESIYPDQVYRARFSLIAPNREGVYHYYFRMVGPLISTYSFLDTFGPYHTVTVEVSENPNARRSIAGDSDTGPTPPAPRPRPMSSGSMVPHDIP